MLNSFCRFALPVLLLLLPVAASAQTQIAANDTLETVVVSASKLDRPLGSLSQAASVVTQETIEEKSFTDVTEILRGLPAMDFKKAGAPGQFNYPKLRGFSDSILFLIDGVKINEPSSGNAGIVLGQLDPSAIARIEVLRGPQATLYGADSTAGVVSITTKDGSKPGASITGEAGSLNWRKGIASFRDNREVGGGNLVYALNFSKLQSDGVNKFEFSENQTIQGKLDYKIQTGIGQVKVGGSYYQTDNVFQYAELSEAFCCQTPATYWSFQTPDPHQTTATKEDVGSAYIENQINGEISHRLQFGSLVKHYDLRDKADGLLGTQPAPFDNFADAINFTSAIYSKGAPIPIFDTFSDSDSFYTDKSNQLDYTVIYKTSSAGMVAGIEYADQKASQTGSFGVSGGKQRIYSYYALGEIHLLDNRLTASAGARLDDYSYSWGQADTYNVGAVYQAADDTALFANYGISFGAPTMFELYNLNYGSRSLKPENGKTYEAGIRQSLAGGRLLLQATYWHSNVTDVILYDFTIPNPANPFGGFGQYANGTQKRTSGVEVEADYDLTDKLSLNANYTYTEAKQQDLFGVWSPLVQVARNKGNVGISYHEDRWSAGANVYVTGPRLRAAGDISTPGYTRVDIFGRYRLLDALTAYARIEDALNSNIVEELGYKQPRLYGIAGVEYAFF